MQIVPSEITEQELIEAAELVPHLWVLQNELVNESGQIIEFEKRSFLKAIYDDLSAKIAIAKPPQIGATVMNCLKAFYVAHELFKDLIYTLPTQSDVQDIVGGSFNRIIAQNPILQEWVHDHDTVEQKSVGKNLIRFRGTFSSKQATMVPSSGNIHDEVDSSDPEVLTLYQTRQEAQEREEDKWSWYFSHPSLVGHGVDIYMQKSDYKEWYITCDNGHEEYMSWPESIDISKEVYICKVCQTSLSDEQRINGRWKNKDGIVWNGKIEGGYEFSGWHISQLHLYNKSAKDIIKAFNDPQKDKQYFYNYVLGLPYIGSEDRIEPSVVLRNCTDVPNDYYSERCVIGADTSHGINYVLMNSQGVFYYDRAEEITASKDPYDAIRDKLKRFEKSVAVFDQGGDLIGVRKLQQEYPGRVFLCFYRKDKKSNDYVDWGENEDYGIVRVDRNRQMTLLVEQLRDTGRIRLNGTQEEWADFAAQFNNIYREKLVVKAQPEKDDKTLYGSEYVWKRNGHDDYCFVAGTKIKTFWGDEKIENIQVGSNVLTRKGWKRVYHVGKTESNQRVLTAYFSNGARFTATAGHPIMTTNGKIRLDSIDSHAILYSWSKQKSSSTKEGSIADILILPTDQTESITGDMTNGKKVPNHFIAKYGLIGMEKSLKGLSFIIETAMRLITRLQTWSVNRERFIKVITLSKDSKMISLGQGTWNIWHELERSRMTGSQPQKVKGIYKLMPSKLLSWSNPKLLTVLSVILKQLHNGRRAVSSVPPDVVIVGLHENIERRDVINIAVEDEAEYFAESILVSNCHALLYAMVGLQRFTNTEAKIFGGKSVMDGLRKAQIVSDGGVQLMWPK